MILVTDEKNVCGFLEFELIKLAGRINVSGNLTDGQVEFIASQLVRAYPNESIADFKICFERGASGAYGKIFKLDGVEIGIWMSGIRDDEGNVKQRGYLDEKYEVLENQLMKEKDNPYQRASTNPDWLKLWADAVAKTDSEGGVKTKSQNLAILSNIRSITDKEIREEGQEKPKFKPHPYTPLSIIEERELHFQYIRENYDTYTGKPNANWMPEDEWRNKKATE